MRWSDLEAAQPRLVGIGSTKLTGPGVVLVGTVRADGTARISPVEPLLWDGDLWLCMGWGTRKARDLRRDPRVLVHSIVTSRDGTDGEFKLRGAALEVTDDRTLAGYADEARSRLGWSAEVGRFHLFRVDVHDVSFVRWDDATNDQYVTRWPEGAEFVRRGTSPTSQGPAEEWADLLA